MGSMATMLSRKLDALARRLDKSQGVFVVATTSPFTVLLDGETDPAFAVPGVKHVGSTYSVGTKGRYFLDQGLQPLCLPTA